MAMWGGRFGAETDKELAKFSESISYDRRLYPYDIAGSKAHVKMLGATGIIPVATAKAIEDGLEEILHLIQDGKFTFKQELEDIHMNIESALIDKLGPEGARLHSARSRNDQVALDMADANKTVIMPGFTHLQHAQVVLFAHHLLAYVEMFDRDFDRLDDCYKRVNVMPLGAGAIAGTTLPIDREMVCRELDFARITRNSMDSVADRDFIIELLADLAIFAMHVSRLSEDLILWCSQEFAFIELGDAFCTGSSLMPQKKNPDIAELSRGKTGRIYGSLMALLTLCKGLPLTYNRDLQEDKESLFDAIDTVKMILRVYPPMIATASVRKENMYNAASDPALMATDIAELLVKIGVPFRTAHHQVGALVKYCNDHNRKLNEISLEEMRISIPDATEEFLAVFDPEASVGKREIPGGTGFNAVRQQLEYWRNRL